MARQASKLRLELKKVTKLVVKQLFIVIKINIKMTDLPLKQVN